MEPNWMIPLERDVLQAAISLNANFSRYSLCEVSGYSMKEVKVALGWLKHRGMIESVDRRLRVTESAKIVFAIMLGKRSHALAKKRGEENAAKVHDTRQAW